jgi:hypothetical protein
LNTSFRLAKNIAKQKVILLAFQAWTELMIQSEALNVTSSRLTSSHGPVETLVALRVEILHLGESLLQLVLCLNQSLGAFLTLSALKQ